MNIAYGWGAMMFFSVVRYFQEQNEQGLLDIGFDDAEKKCKGINEGTEKVPVGIRP